MKKISLLFILLLMTANLTACGYKLIGMENNSVQKSEMSEIEEGATISIGTIEQPSIYMNISFELATIIRDEVSLRRLGTWANNGEGDYLINATIPSFRISSFEDNNYEEVLISSIDIVLILSIVNSETNAPIWTSGTISYSENYESPRQSSAIQEILQDVVQIAFESYQGNF